MNKLSKMRKTIFVFALLLTMLVIALGACADVKTLTANARVGDKIAFGVLDEKPIVWKVLAIQDESALLTIAHDMGYENMPMQYEDTWEWEDGLGGRIWTYVSWEDCSLRKWLNDDFLTFFSDDEQNRIQTTELSDESGVKDKVFIFSMEEAEKYFPNDKSRIFYYTNKYVEKEYTISWWLRVKDNTNDLLSTCPYVSQDGSINENLDEFDPLHLYDFLAVRPAMWVSLDGLE